MGTCPDCDENFEVEEDTDIGDLVECPKCHVRLEVLNLAPVSFDYASEVED